MKESEASPINQRPNFRACCPARCGIEAIDDAKVVPMKKLLTLSLLLTMVTHVQAVLVNVGLDAPAYANAPLYNGDTIARLTDGFRNQQIHSDVTPPLEFAYWIDLGAS